MVKVTIYKIQRIGGKRLQFMQSIGFMKESDACLQEAESDSRTTIRYEDWLESKDEEIGYWESLRPFWF